MADGQTPIDLGSSTPQHSCQETNQVGQDLSEIIKQLYTHEEVEEIISSSLRIAGDIIKTRKALGGKAEQAQGYSRSGTYGNGQVSGGYGNSIYKKQYVPYQGQAQQQQQQYVPNVAYNRAPGGYYRS